MKARYGKNEVSAPRQVNPEAAELPPPRSRPASWLLKRKYRELICTHLGQILDRLFAEFTGLHFHIAWTKDGSNGWRSKLPAGCSVCCKLSGSPLHAECQTCGPRRLLKTLESKEGHRFTCRLGVRNYWVPIRVRHETLGIAYLQALEHTIDRRPAETVPSQRKRHRLHRSGAIVMSRLRFARAARLLRLIVEHVQTATLSDLRKADLSRAGRAVVALEREQARLRVTLERHLPATYQTPRKYGPESRTEQVVKDLLEQVELDYIKPITLQKFARDLGMNAAYLSDIFSSSIGIPFKTYLTELRLQRAKELLGNPAKNTSEIAFAVGYSSEDRFRSAFRKATGLSPRAWRETMQPNPAPVQGSFSSRDK
jgi:AraC-like DNA-binding protein